MYSWGACDFGQLGHGRKVPTSTPRLILQGKSIVSVAAGRYHCCALNTYGCVYHLRVIRITIRASGWTEMCVRFEVPILMLMAWSRYSWGCGESGQLGHGNDQTVLLHR